MSNGSKKQDRLEDLVVGFVSPIGTDIDPVCRALSASFERLGYASKEFKLSNFLNQSMIRGILKHDFSHKSESDRYEKLMSAGNQFRTEMRRADALSMVAVGAIRDHRNTSEAQKRVYVLRSLKHQDEVKSLRNIYGPAFLLFSLSSSRTSRVKHLASQLCKSDQKFTSSDFLPDAEKLVNRDQQEANDPMGQNVRKAFPLADFFIDVDHGMEAAIKRIVELILGNPFIAPTRSEYGMFLAHGASLRSASLQRQVGAVITSNEGEVIAVGANEVPKAGGGLYWEGDSPDYRDFKKGGEINDDMKNRMLVEVVQRIVDSGMTFPKKHQLANVTNARKITDWLISKGDMGDARITGIIEFGRCVHAEMAALMDSARRGVAVDGGILYSTTFPCHECARHIVAAGIPKVYYIEPYPKSMVNELYPDSIQVEGETCGQMTSFVPFVGVAPRRYLDVFRMGSRDRKELVQNAHNWNASLAQPKLGEYPERTQLINIALEHRSFEKFLLELKVKSHGKNRT